jgi:2-keto-4-pentenoate hydratase/2-oxohepta-3-ene-1,7-dioic acid hydratase in catechol pathway
VRLYRYQPKGGAESKTCVAVALGSDPPVDLIEAWSQVKGAPTTDELRHTLSSPLKLIEAGIETWVNVQDVARLAEGLPGALTPGSRLLSPLDSVPSLRDFLAFEDHVLRGAERRRSQVPEYWYKAPIYYKGNHRSIIGPDAMCPWPGYSKRVDFELELAMIVGRRGKDVAVGDAPLHLFGFTILNDFSARDVQALEMTAWLGPSKGKDFATALGPCIVTADEIGAQPDLEMICRVNGEEWGRSRSSKARWKWADMIAHVSQDEEIFPGDVYGSGTPGGCCGLDLGRDLNPGDVVELEIERIGILRNTIGPRTY